MKLFTWTNMYLSSVQKGIQSLHLATDLFVNYPKRRPMDQIHATLLDWAISHKTVIVFDGGSCANLELIFNIIENHASFHIHGKFHEDKESLNGALTCVGVLLPESIYSAPRPSKGVEKFETWLETFLDPSTRWNMRQIVELLDSSKPAV